MVVLSTEQTQQFNQNKGWRNCYQNVNSNLKDLNQCRVYRCLFAVGVLVKFVQFGFNVNQNICKCKQDSSLTYVRTKCRFLC